MEIKSHKQLLIVVMVIALFVLIISLVSLYAQRVISCGEAQTCTIPIPFLIPITASAGLFIGTLVYYLMTGQIIRKEKNITNYSEMIKNLLSNEEIIVLKIIAKNSQISQARIASLAGMPRLKVFRVVEKLKEKNLIEKQEEGRARVIKIKEEIKGLIS